MEPYEAAVAAFLVQRFPWAGLKSHHLRFLATDKGQHFLEQRLLEVGTFTRYDELKCFSEFVQIPPFRCLEMLRISKGIQNVTPEEVVLLGAGRISAGVADIQDAKDGFFFQRRLNPKNLLRVIAPAAWQGGGELIGFRAPLPHEGNELRPLLLRDAEKHIERGAYFAFLEEPF